MDAGRIVVAHVVRFLAASQATVALVLHGAWILLVIATWQASDPGGDATSVTRPLLRAFVWLGGIGPDGRGDETHLARAMALLAVPFYLLASLRKDAGDGRAPLLPRILKWSAASGLVALAGYGRGFTTGGGLSGLEASFGALALSVITAAATAWAVAADRIGEIVIARLHR